jgi:hypothetical protein
MKKDRYISDMLLVFAAFLAAACTDSDMTDEALNGANGDAPFTIAGTSGSGVLNLDASYGEYAAFINVPGKWSIATSKGLANVYPSVGEGPTRVVVQVGENWGSVRENILTLTTEGATRAGGDTPYSMTLVQSGNPQLDSVSTVFSSNKGAGYSYMPGGEYCDGALIQLFNLVTLDSIQRATGIRLISDDIFPQTSQEYLTSNSESGLVKSLEVNASAGMNFGSAKGKGSGNINAGVNIDHEEKSRNKYALKRMKNTQFTREIHYMNIMALLEKAATREEKRKLLSPGFLSVQERFADNIAAAKGNETRQYDLCNKFLDEIGPCFISKSVMGTVLDYQISVDSTALRDTLGIEVALEASFQAKVKAKSANGEVTFNIGVSKEAKELTEKTTATVKVRGGDVSKVCILVSGGSLDDSDITAWQNSCTPTLAVMVDMALVPIYVLITDEYAREVLKSYFELKSKE